MVLRKSKTAKKKSEWAVGRHWCGDGFRGHIVKAKGLTFCNLCGKEKRLAF